MSQLQLDELNRGISLPILAAEYVCPGESYPISRSIHLARLSSFYSRCRECDHRNDVGHNSVHSVHTPGHSIERSGAIPLAAISETFPSGAASAPRFLDVSPFLANTKNRGADAAPLGSLISNRERYSVHRASRTSLLETDGVRGIYLNELDRTRAAEWGAALASMLWDDEPRVGSAGRSDGETERPRDREIRGELEDGSGDDACHSSLPVSLSLRLSVPESPRRTSSPRRGPVIAVGFDERPASPDIVTGVALGLRRMGCQVIDLGQTTAPCFQFAVQHLEAAAGMFVTGAGCDPAWTGFDVVGRSARPWSMGHKLEELESRARAGVMRPTRAAGSQRTFQALVPYEAGLWKHFHALRPLHVACGSATKQFPHIIDRLFARLPCRVTHVTLPVRRRDLRDEQDSDVRRVAAAVVSGGLHLGLIADDDGQRCAFVTERGRLISPGELARVLIGFERQEHHNLKVVATAALAGELAPWLVRLGIEAVISDESAAAVTTKLAERRSQLGMLNDGRVWFGESPPASDAIVTLARVLQALSLSDASFGEIISEGR